MRPEGAPGVAAGEDARDRDEEAGNRDQVADTEETAGERVEEEIEGDPEEKTLETAQAEIAALANQAPQETPSRPTRRRAGHRLFSGDNEDGGFSLIERGHGYKGLRNLYGCHFFLKRTF